MIHPACLSEEERQAEYARRFRTLRHVEHPIAHGIHGHVNIHVFECLVDAWDERRFYLAAIVKPTYEIIAVHEPCCPVNELDATRARLIAGIDDLPLVIDVDWLKRVGLDFCFPVMRWNGSQWVKHDQPKVDYKNGEWRCKCLESNDYDTSINPSFVRACVRCGTQRPK